MHRATMTEVCGLTIQLIAVTNPNYIVSLWTGGYTQANLWFQTDFQNLPIGDYYIRLEPGVTGGCDVYVDDVQAMGTTGDTPSGTPTPGPTATFGPTPTRTPTPQTAATMSSSSARSAVTMGTPVPYFDPNWNQNPVIPVTLNGNTNPNPTNLVMSNRPLSFCLPSQVSDIFSDMDLCLSIPMVSIDAMSVAGFDFMPFLSIAASVLFISFIIIRLRNR